MIGLVVENMNVQDLLRQAKADYEAVFGVMGGVVDG